MMNKLNLFDPLAGMRHESKGIWFTWSNFQKGDRRIYLRLDRFYLNKMWFSYKPQSDNNCVKVIPYTLSDHHPIMASYQMIGEQCIESPPKQSFALNTSLLKDDAVKSAIRVIVWYNEKVVRHESSIERWEQTSKSWKGMLKAVGRKKAKDARRREVELVESLQEAEGEIQSNPHSEALLNKVILCRNSLRKLQLFKTRGAKVRARINWINLGDRGSKFFFQTLKKKEARDKICSIRTQDSVVSSQQEVLEAFSSFYKELITSLEPAPTWMLPGLRLDPSSLRKLRMKRLRF